MSDDDFARTSIAQGFAQAPALDPTGSSWLPFPFWLIGSVMRWTEPSFAVAQATSWVLSCFASVLVYFAARLVQLSAPRALIAALLLAVFPYSAWLGAAPIPDGYTAGLCLFALAAHSHRRHWLSASVALLAATLSRYEAWPVAFTVAAFCFRDARQERCVRRAACGAMACAGPVLWLTHGWAHHGDALFFVKRVTDYKRALGLDAGDFIQNVLHYPKLLLLTAPELSAFVGVSVVLGFKGFLAPNTRRLLWGALAVLLFLVWGNLKDGAPTHHAARPLMLLWFALTVAAVGAFPVPSLAPLRSRAAALLLLVPIALAPLRTHLVPPHFFQTRHQELSIGERARAMVGAESVVIDHPNYGYFAVMVGLGRAHAVAPLRDYDPRLKAADPWRSEAALRALLEEHHARWLIATTENLPKAARVGDVVLKTDAFALLKLK